MPMCVFKKNVVNDFKPLHSSATLLLKKVKRGPKLPLLELREYLKSDKIGRHADAIRQLFDDGETNLADIPNSKGHKSPNRVRYDLRRIFSKYSGIRHKGDIYFLQEDEEGSAETDTEVTE